MQAAVTGFFDDATNTITYVVRDPETSLCAVVDPVLDYDQAAGATKPACLCATITAHPSVKPLPGRLRSQNSGPKTFT